MTIKREYISTNLLYHHPRNYCQEVNDLGCRLVVQHEGRDVAALVTMDDLRLLEQVKAKDKAGVSLAEIDEVA